MPSAAGPFPQAVPGPLSPLVPPVAPRVSPSRGRCAVGLWRQESAPAGLCELVELTLRRAQGVGPG